MTVYPHNNPTSSDEDIPERLLTLDAYDFELPPELIAQHPADRRDHSRLLHLAPSAGRVMHRRFYELPDLLRSGDLLVVNNTRVIPARLIGRKPSGGKVEIFLSRPLAARRWEALVHMSGKVRPGREILVDGERVVVEEALGEGLWAIRFDTSRDPMELIETVGGIPLPPYIHRAEGELRCEQDRRRYQTVYARHAGAVAAPTAGLHFTDEVFERLQAKGVRRAEVTLHVGLGTFQPIREQNLEKATLHVERYRLPEETLESIARCRRDGGCVVAVGTTTVRVLETAASRGRWYAHEGETDIFIRPGYRFQAVDAMLTNFHLPKSSLLMLVAAFAGKELIDRAYRIAVQERYRFFSYGDAMLIG